MRLWLLKEPKRKILRGFQGGGSFFRLNEKFFSVRPMSYRALFSFVWQSVRPYKFFLLLILVLSTIWSLEAILWPYILRLVVDGLTAFQDNREAVWTVLQWPITLAIALWVGTDIGTSAQGFLVAWLVPKMEAEVRMNVFDHVQKHSPAYFNKNFAGTLTNKIADLTGEVTSIWGQLISVFVPFIGAFVLATLFFFQVRPIFAVLIFIWMVLHILISLFFARYSAHYEQIHGETRSDLYGKIVDSLTNNMTVNLFFRFVDEFKTVSLFQQRERTAHSQSARVTQYLQIVLSALTFLVGGLLINGLMFHFWGQGAVSTGEVVQVFSTSTNIMMLLFGLSSSIPALFGSMGMAMQALTLLEAPQDVLDSQEAKPLVVTNGEIVFENVSFQYGQKGLFENKSIVIKGGEKVGVVGFTGAGKTTFVNLILRFYPLKSGKICIDGQDISEVTLESLRSQIALVPQDPILFHRTIKENIRYGRLDATDQEVEEASKAAHCDNFIERFSEGYETVVGERGTALSSGERQRIAIARAMLSKAPILILDEATSSQDSITEKYIQEGFEKLMQKRTAIVIAHRLSTLKKMDRIVVFEKGKIVEEGNHQDLISQHGPYAHMWDVQAGGFSSTYTIL